MTDKLVKRHSRDIPIKIEGVTRYIKNVTKVTTCCDVIKMILKKMDIGKENLPYYTIFESANGVDRPLAGKTCILKTIRSWGTDTSYKLILRKSAPAVTYIPHLSEAKRQKLSQWSKSSNSSFSSENEEINKRKDLAVLKENVTKQRRKYLKDKYRISNRELSRQLFADDTSDDNDSMDEFMSQVDAGKLTEFWDFCTAITESEIKRMASIEPRKCNTTPNSICGGTDKTSEVKFAVRKKLKNFESMGNLREVDGKKELMQKYFSDMSSYETPGQRKMKRFTRRHYAHGVKETRSCSSPKRNAFYWSVHSDSDSTETDLDSSLEKAFIDECNISDKFNDSGIKVKLPSEFNEIHNGHKLVDYTLSDVEDDDMLMDNKKFDFRKFWESNDVYNEDEEMDSFMKTKIHEDFSDEGLSSMGSDEEREILV